MRRAIELSRTAGIESKTGGCFGAVVVKDGEIIGEGSNHVLAKNDPTWHGEIEAIREASKNLQTPHLDGAILYTSAEPCPMCLSASYWAHIKEIYYGATYDDVMNYGEFQDKSFRDELLKKPSDRKIPSFNIEREEAIEVWKEYQQMPDKRHY